MTLSRDDILNTKDREVRAVDVPEWGKVNVIGLSGKDRDAFEASLMQTRADGTVVPNYGNMRAKLLVKAIVDDDGKRIFTDQDANALGEKSGAALQRVFEVVQELSGMTPASAEEIEGNSDAAQSGDSTSD